MKVFILNGPPGVGKDTIGRLLDMPVETFKEDLYDLAGKFFGVSPFTVKALNEDRSTKEKRIGVLSIPGTENTTLAGMSPRQALIYVSERVVKPMFGKQYFGKTVVERLRRKYPDGAKILFTDGGFPEEVDELCEDGIEVHVIRLKSPGYDFRGDSRLYLSACYTEHEVTFHDVALERGEITKGVEEVRKIIMEA